MMKNLLFLDKKTLMYFLIMEMQVKIWGIKKQNKLYGSNTSNYKSIFKDDKVFNFHMYCRLVIIVSYYLILEDFK